MSASVLLRLLAVCGCAAAVVLAFVPAAAEASDHADPTFNTRLEAGITDLFAFPTKKGSRRTEKGDPIEVKDADKLVLILCTRRSLAKSPPYDGLDELTFRIHLDLRRGVAFTNEADLLRYGGTVEHPETIKEDVTLEFRFDNVARVQRLDAREAGENGQRPGAGEGIVTGLKKGARVEWYAGVRDDPFIFPQFFGTNVIAFVVAIPFDAFPADPNYPTWLIWGTSSRHGSQIDHVGRSQRTQLPRFDFLNPLHPKDHVAAIKERQENPGLFADVARKYVMTEFAIRGYDRHPDVMVFAKNKTVTFPNGRQLEDDVADLTCKQGDCQLFELSFSHPRSTSQGGFRPTKNDKKFLEAWPYLAEPWENAMEPPPRELTMKNQMLVYVLAFAAAVFLLLPWVLYFRALRRLKAVSRQVGTGRQPPRPVESPAPTAPPPPPPQANRTGPATSAPRGDSQ